MLNRLMMPVALLVVAVAALIGVLFLNAQLPGTEAAKSASTAVTVGGPFTLQSGDGKSVTPRAEMGHPFLVFFGYTHCPDICPTTLAQITAVFAKLGPQAKIAALFITVDPQRDTPKLMQEYVSSFDPRIIGLSGTPAQVDGAIKAYKVFASKEPGKNTEYLMSHSAVVYLMDRQGNFVNAVNLEQSPDAVAKELSTFL